MMAIRLVMILVLFLAGGFHIWQKRKNQVSNEEFDERQRFLMGQSYKYAAGSSWILIVLLSLTNAVYPDLLSISFILACLLFLPLTVFGVSNILNDAYYPVKSSGKWKRLSPQKGLAIFGVIAVFSLFFLFDGNSDVGFFQKGGNGNFLILLLTSLGLATAFSYKLLKDRDEGDTDG